MNTLSVRAKEFLSGRERFATTTAREQIEKVFVQSNAPVFEPLIYFQQQYSGYDLSIDKDIPFIYNLLRGEGGYPLLSDSAFIEFIDNNRYGEPRYFFALDSDEMMIWALDESGIYYECKSPIATSFDKYIEQLAIEDEIYKKGLTQLSDYKTKYRPDISEKPNLLIISEASDVYTQWFSDGKTYLRQRQDSIMVFSS